MDLRKNLETGRKARETTKVVTGTLLTGLSDIGYKIATRRFGGLPVGTIFIRVQFWSVMFLISGIKAIAGKWGRGND